MFLQFDKLTFMFLPLCWFPRHFKCGSKIGGCEGMFENGINS